MTVVEHGLSVVVMKINAVIQGSCYVCGMATYEWDNSGARGSANVLQYY